MEEENSGTSGMLDEIKADYKYDRNLQGYIIDRSFFLVLLYPNDYDNSRRFIILNDGNWEAEINADSADDARQQFDEFCRRRGTK